MKSFTESIRSCLKSENWHGALTISLILPDICGNIEYPNQQVGKRYKAWYEKYVSQGPNLEDDPKGKLYRYPSAADCYSLRCSIIHAGSEEISNSKTKEIVGRYHFFKPEGGFTLYGHQAGNIAQLQVDKFCEKMCLGAEYWELLKLEASSNQDDLNNNIVRIRSPSKDGIKLTSV